MAKLPRVTAKIFASKANPNDIGQFGSALTGTKVNTGDISEIQALPAFEEGWRDAVISQRNYPTLQETNGQQKVLSQQIAYALETGMPEWDAATEYSANTSFCQVNGVWYQSLTNNNIGNNPTEDTTNWKEISFSGSSSSSSTSLPLFTPILMDRVLDFKESKGYALQGTWVYKNSAPERYGYPDFYNKCIEEKNTATEKLALKLNVTTTGSPTIDNGVVSNFSNSSYLTTPSAPTEIITSFEFGFEFNTGTDVTTQQGILANNGANYTTPQVYIKEGKVSSLTPIDGSTWGNVISTSISANTHYKGRYTWDGNSLNLYLAEGENAEVLVGTQDQSVCYWVNKIEIGNDQENYPFNGSIDLKETYININGERFWSGSTVGYQNPNGHVFYDVADKASIDELFQNQGVAWMYGVDTENERIFLPRNDYFMQASTDVDKIGQSVSAGLPNITGQTKNTQIFFQGRDNAGTVGAITIEQTGIVALSSGGGTQSYNSLSFDASLSNPIYGSSNTVQPISSINALYIVVGNTEEEKSITDITEITTSENDTLPLFTGMYFDFKPNNPSWLKAGTQKNSGGIYTSCYNTLVNCLTAANNIYDLKVIATSDMVEGTDYSEYWKVNQDEMYFITPTSNGEESSAQLYFKVANAVQNLELLNAGEVLEVLADKTNAAQAATAAMPSGKYVDLILGASGTTYTAPANGWFIFGRRCSANGQYLGTYSDPLYKYIETWGANNYMCCVGPLPVRKGQSVRVNYTAAGGNTIARFIYAQGSESEEE